MSDGSEQVGHNGSIDNQFLAATFDLVEQNQRLQQEKETFEQLKSQDAKWFYVRCAMAWVAAITLPAVLIICAVIIFNPSEYSANTVTAATATLLVDAAATMFSVWKLVLGQQGTRALAPVTRQVDRQSGL